MADYFALQDDFDSRPSPGRRSKRNGRGHHRPWWNFNVIPLALALFPLVYVRHLWNAGNALIFSCVFVIFVVWISAGCLGLSLRAQADRRDIAPLLRANFASTLFATALITFFLAAIALSGNLAGVGSGRVFLLLFSMSPSTLPVFVALAIGMSIVVRKRAKCPKTWRYASMGLGGLMFSSVVTTLLSILGFPPFLSRQSYTEVLIFIWTKAILLSLLDVTCWVLIIMALLADDSPD